MTSFAQLLNSVMLLPFFRKIVGVFSKAILTEGSPVSKSKWFSPVLLTWYEVTRCGRVICDQTPTFVFLNRKIVFEKMVNAIKCGAYRKQVSLSNISKKKEGRF